MMEKTDALQYIQHRLADKEFAKRALAEMIYDKHSRSDRFDKAVAQWKSQPAGTTPSTMPGKPAVVMLNKVDDTLFESGNWDNIE